MKTGYDVVTNQVSRFFETLEKIVPFGVDVGGRHVGDLSGRVAQSNALVVDG